MSRLKQDRSMAVLPLVLGFILAWSCAGSKSFDLGNSETGYRLSYRPQRGDLFQYEDRMKGSNSSERDGQSFESTYERTFVYHLKAEKSDSLLPFLFTIDTLGFSIEGPQGIRTMDYSAYFGKRARVFFTPRGVQRHEKTVLLDSIPSDETDPFMRTDPKIQFSSGFFKLPDRSVKAGDSWTDSRIDTTRQMFRTTITEYHITWTVLGEEIRMGLSCLHIRSETASATEMTSTMRGTEMSMEAEGESTEEIWFAFKEGILIEKTGSSFSEGTTAFTGQMSGTMPSTKESTLSVKLVKWKPV